MIVVFNKKTGKGRQTHPATSAKEEKERARQLELNPRASSTRKKVKRKNFSSVCELCWYLNKWLSVIHFCCMLC